MIEPDIRPARCPHYPGQKGFELLTDYTFELLTGGFMTIPAGFWYNAGSIPNLFWQLTFSPYDPDILAGTLIHDWCYTTHCVDKPIADRMLYKAILDHGFNVKATLVDGAIKAFGASSWKHTADDMRYLNTLRNSIRASGRSLVKYGLG